MSKNVSFVARDELAEWLEQRADREMKSISSICQDIIAEEYLREHGEKTAKGREQTAKAEQEPSGPLDQEPFTDHPDAWYEPDTQDPDEVVAVRIPDHTHVSEGRRYYKTYEGAATAIRRWYE